MQQKNNHQYQNVKKLFTIFLNKTLQHKTNLIFANIWDDFSKFYGYSKEDNIYEQIKILFLNLYNLEYLEPFLKSDFEEIIIHNSKTIQIIGGNSSSNIAICLNQSDYLLSLNILCIRNKVNWNIKTPFSSFGYSRDGENYRITLIHSNISAKNDPKIFIRKLKYTPYKLNNYIGLDNISILHEIIKTKSNVIISGKTGSGKTSLMKSMLDYTNKTEHIVILEDTHEINLPNHPHTTHLISKEVENYKLDDYCSYALRMRPDRIILGELRSKEIIPFFLTMNNGHKGLISSVHASSTQNTVERLALLFKIYSTKDMNYETVMSLICSNIDYIIYIEDKKITNISKLLGHENNVVFLDNIFN